MHCQQCGVQQAGSQRAHRGQSACMHCRQCGPSLARAPEKHVKCTLVHTLSALPGGEGRFGRSSAEGRSAVAPPLNRFLGPSGRSVFFTLEPGSCRSKASSPTCMRPKGRLFFALSARSLGLEVLLSALLAAPLVASAACKMYALVEETGSGTLSTCQQLVMALINSLQLHLP